MIWMLLAVVLPFVASLIGTEAVRRYAIRTSMVDVPNDRSSHKVPTPRGGGIAMVATIVCVLVVLVCSIPGQFRTSAGILGGGMLVAIVGMLDDRFDLSARLRLGVQVVAAVWLLTCLGGPGNLEILGFSLGWLSIPVAILFVVWSTNVYNFMDGLDGFAGGQAVVAATAATWLATQAGDSVLSFTMLATVGAAGGFLVWNWPAARIFMGDCGSGFLGFLFAAYAIAAHKSGTASFTAGVALLLVFYVDATLTLLRRIVQGEQWLKPHRSHAYQLATQMGASHKQVTIASIFLFATASTLACYLVSTDKAVITSNGTPIVLISFAILLAGTWLIINWLFTGRTRALATIKSGKGSGPRITNEAAAVTYLRFRQLQTKFRSWRKIVPRNDLLAEATGAASQLGYTVSHDWLDGCGGGSCEAAGEKWILLDFNMARQDQIRQILLAILDETDKLDGISPDLQSAIRETKSSTTLLKKAA